jgi:hypothetical protein
MSSVFQATFFKQHLQSTDTEQSHQIKVGQTSESNEPIFTVKLLKNFFFTDGPKYIFLISEVAISCKARSIP